MRIKNPPRNSNYPPTYQEKGNTLSTGEHQTEIPGNNFIHG